MEKKAFGVCAIVLAVIAIIINSFGRYIFSTDELWNFVNVVKITNNFSELYRGANVIVTPLFFIISTLLFRIFGANIIVFRAFNVVIKFAIFMLMYSTTKKMISSKNLSLVAALGYTFLITRLDNGANYNDFAMIFVLCGILLHLSRSEKNYKYEILQGIIIYLIFMSKQNIAVYYILSNVIINFVLIKDKKKAILMLSIQAITFILLTIITSGIFIKIGMFDGLINYAFLGIGNFTNNFSVGFDFLEIIKYALIIISALVFMFVYFSKSGEEIKDKKDKFIILATSGICMFGYIIPIINTYHLAYGFLVFYIFIISIICSIFEDIITENIKWYSCALFILLYLVYIGYVSAILIKNNGDFYTGDEYIELKYSYITKETLSEIQKVNEYMDAKEAEGKNIKMFNYRACYRYIHSKKPNGFYDLPFLGNFGALDEKAVLDAITEDKDTYIIILNEDNMFGQESKYINSYIRDNFNKVDEFLDYEVYYID